MLPNCILDKMRLGQWGNPVLRVVLLGTSDPGSPLHLLRGQRDILKIIFDDLADLWRTHIVYPEAPVRHEVGCWKLYPSQPFARLGAVEFPKPTDIQINMMPFIYGRKASLPKELWPYWPMILNNCYCQQLQDKVCYLTIHESLVKAGESQRRPGLHTDSPGELRVGGHGRDYWTHIAWGGEAGGIYMASNVANSCAVWPIKAKNLGFVAGRAGHGDLEHLRGVLPRPTVMQPNRMYWMTDHTPHESLPLEKTTYRQFFRLVTEQVSVWFARHSTPSPTGVMPNCRIVHWDKFGDAAQETTKKSMKTWNEPRSDESSLGSDDDPTEMKYFDDVDVKCDSQSTDQSRPQAQQWTVDSSWKEKRKLFLKEVCF